MSRKIKMGVIGAGVFGGYHANKLAAHPDIDFIGAYDRNKQSVRRLAKKHNIRVFESFDLLLSEVEAIVIATPALAHGETAIAALELGKHCLIEKPIAANLEDAEKIIKLSEVNDLTVQIGHQERFVAKAIGLDKIPERPLKIDAKRLGSPSERGSDVSVTLDLMTHDLDLVLMLMGEMPSAVEGETRSVNTPFSDETQACLTFGAAKVTLEASRLAPDYKRVMEITYPSGQVKIDFNAKTLTHDTPFDLDANFADNPMAQDSLGAAMESFVRAILEQEAPVIVSAQDGYNALKLALAVEEEGG